MVKQMLAPDYPYPMEHNRNLLVPLELGGYSVFKEGTEKLTDEAREIVALCKNTTAFWRQAIFLRRKPSRSSRKVKTRG